MPLTSTAVVALPRLSSRGAFGDRHSTSPSSLSPFSLPVPSSPAFLLPLLHVFLLRS